MLMSTADPCLAPLRAREDADETVARHIGISATDEASMLSVIGAVALASRVGQSTSTTLSVADDVLPNASSTCGR